MQLSLKWNIQLWYALILGMVLATLGTGFFYYEKSRRLSELDTSLDAQLPPLLSPRRLFPERHSEPVREPRDDRRNEAQDIPGWQRRDDPAAFKMRGDPEADVGNSLFDAYFVPKGYYAKVIWKMSGEGIYQSRNFPDIEVPVGKYGGYHYRTREGHFRELLHSSPRFNILVGLDLVEFESGLSRLRTEIIAVLFTIFVLGVLIGYVLVSRSLLPLKQIEETVQRIAGGKLSERIPAIRKGRSRELVYLAGNLNNTFEKLESLFTRQIRFTADASHELRTPLTALLAQLELGRKRVRTPEEYDHIMKVSMRSASRIARITEQLIELSRYDSGRVRLDYTALPLDGMLLGLTEELEASVKERGSVLQLELARGTIRCDPFRLEQVISNLVNNAMQHNSRPITICLRGYFEGDNAIIEVTDNGKGIKPENVERLFDRFYQEDSSHSKNQYRDNVGLGLAISRAIIEAHGGTISVKSVPEVETTFTIVLPQHEEGDDAPEDAT